MPRPLDPGAGGWFATPAPAPAPAPAVPGPTVPSREAEPGLADEPRYDPPPLGTPGPGGRAMPQPAERPWLSVTTVTFAVVIATAVALLVYFLFR